MHLTYSGVLDLPGNTRLTRKYPGHIIIDLPGNTRLTRKIFRLTREILLTYPEILDLPGKYC